MRDYKFRAKRLDNGEWVYGLLDYNADLKPEYAWSIVWWEQDPDDPDDTIRCQEKVDPETVGQYTGLLDKNGKEIYEGDVVETIRKEQPYRYSIIWNGPAARWDLQPTDLPSSQPFGGDMNRCEVIGNIYENPELLK